MFPKQKFNFKYVFIVFIAAVFAGTAVSIVSHYVDKEMAALSTYSEFNLQSEKDAALLNK